MTTCPQCHSRNPETSRFCMGCGTSLAPQPRAAPAGETFEIPLGQLSAGSIFAGRYQVVEELGRGGMGRVYRALDRKVNEEVALKLITPEVASDSILLDRFRNELKLARKISHKNVARMYELMEAEGTHFITMEYVPGEDLGRMIRMSRQLSVPTALDIARQIAHGLAEAHRLGVVHRDVKPSNIMIDREGCARILDFGVARSLAEKGVTSAGVLIGTPRYMSPEQREGWDVDGRSDLYSLGVILYEMLAGQTPPGKESPRTPTTPGAGIPEGVTRLIGKCLEKDRAQRFQTAEEFLEQLEVVEKGLTAAGRDTRERDTIRPRMKTPWLAPAALAAAAVLVAGGFFLMRRIVFNPAGPGAGETPSIAVLPFEDLSPQKDQEYLCDGLTESLINSLTHVQALRIPARTSSFSFRDKEYDIREIGNRLNVKTLLEGSVQKARNRIRVTVQLINVEDEALIWSEQYNRELDDVFAIQDEITLSIVGNLKVNLMKGERAALVKRYTGNIEAYELYLKGRYFWEKRTRESLEKAVEYFQQAISRDPRFALAYAGLADGLTTLAWYNFAARDVAASQARRAAETAMSIDDALSEAHVALANVSIDLFWDWEAARRSYVRAVELNPGNAEAHHQYAHFLAQTGRLEEGIAEMKRALELEPLSVVIRSCLGQALFYARRYGEAVEELRKAVDIDPEYREPYGTLGMIRIEEGRYDEAYPLLEKCAASSAFKTRMLGARGYAYALQGKRDEARKILRELSGLAEQQDVEPCFLAWIHAGLGEKDLAFRLLAEAYEKKSNWMLILKTDPFLDNLRPDPRFRTLLGKMNLD